MINLDYLAAQAAPKILAVTDDKQKKKPKLITLLNQALGILAEQGPFALMLWASGQCASRGSDEKIGDTLWKTLVPLLEQTGLAKLDARTKDLNAFNEKICKNFKHLIMTRQLFERVLTYARHSAKAMPEA